MGIVRSSVVTTLDPEEYTEYTSTSFDNGAYSQNALYSKYNNGRVYATQRDSITVRNNTHNLVGRGIYYWGSNEYSVVYATVYSGTTPIASITGSLNPVEFVLVGEYLVILEIGSNSAWYIHSTTPTTVTAIGTLPFSGNILGGVQLDGYLFLLTDKTIWNSAYGDPTTWGGLDFITSDRSDGSGIALKRHHDHIVLFGTNFIEFYYNAGNPTGTPLERRQDTFYNIGAIGTYTVSSLGDSIQFLGFSRNGNIGLYSLEQFAPRKISSGSVDALLSQSFAAITPTFSCSVTLRDHDLYLLSFTVLTNALGYYRYFTLYTLAFDISTGTVSIFDTDASHIEGFSAISVSRQGTYSQPRMMFLTGDVGWFDTKDSRVDQSYTTAPGTITDSAIVFKALFEEEDSSLLTNKFCHRMSVVGTTDSAGADASPIYVSWSDDHYKTFSSERQLTTGENWSLTRLGKYKRRAYMLRYTGSDTLRIEAVEADIRASQYA